MKTSWKSVATAILIFLLCFLVGCGAKQDTLNDIISNVPDRRLMDISVILIDNSSGNNYVCTREPEADEAVFLLPEYSSEGILEEGDFQYILSTNASYAAIVEYTGRLETVKFPSELGGVPVVCLTGLNEHLSDTCSGFRSICTYKEEIKKIILPDTIVAIGPHAFCLSRSLEEISFSESLTHIYQSAFDSCSSLKELTLPNSLISLDYYSFGFCESLTHVTLPEGMEQIGSSAFSHCYNLEEVRLPSSMIYVSEAAFAYCEQLETVYLSENTVLNTKVFQETSTEPDASIPELVYYKADTAEETYESVEEKIEETTYIEDFDGYIENYLDSHSVAVLDPSVVEDTWANDYYDVFSAISEPRIVTHVLDISKISALLSNNHTLHLFDDCDVIWSVLTAYYTLYEEEPTSFTEYRNFEEFYLQSDLSRADNSIIARFFYITNSYVVQIPLSYVQTALDTLYGAGTFHAQDFSNEICCYVPDDSEYLYLQDRYLYTTDEISYKQIAYRLVDIRYLENNTAILFMNVIGSYLQDGSTLIVDYTDQTLLFEKEGIVNYADFNDIFNSDIDLDALGVVKLTLFQDSAGVHIKSFEFES